MRLIARVLPCLIASALPCVAGSAGRQECLTGLAASAQSVASIRPAFLFVAPEERHPLAAGAKLVLVRGAVPEPGAEVLARLVESGYREIVGELGFSAFPDRITVSFADLDGSEGYVGVSGNSAEIVLSRGLSDRQLVLALAHQVGHLAGITQQGEAPRWWSEASASWIASKLVADTAAPGSGADAALFLSYLERRHGSDVIRRIWEQALAHPGEEMARAMEVALAASGSSLRGDMEAYGAWLWSERRGAMDVPTVVPPARGVAGDQGPEPLGVFFLRIALSDLAGGVRIGVDGNASLEWTASAMLVPTGSWVPSGRMALMRTAGRAEIEIPASGTGDLVLMVANLGSEPRLTFGYQVQLEENYPFLLRRLDAVAEPGVVRISWETSSESGLQGWVVRRGSEAGDISSALNHVLVPSGLALGFDSGLEYAWLDEDVEAGRTYTYVVEGITTEGLAAPSHIVSITAR